MACGLFFFQSHFAMIHLTKIKPANALCQDEVVSLIHHQSVISPLSGSYDAAYVNGARLKAQGKI